MARRASCGGTATETSLPARVKEYCLAPTPTLIDTSRERCVRFIQPYAHSPPLTRLTITSSDVRDMPQSHSTSRPEMKNSSQSQNLNRTSIPREPFRYPACIGQRIVLPFLQTFWHSPSLPYFPRRVRRHPRTFALEQYKILKTLPSNIITSLHSPNIMHSHPFFLHYYIPFPLSSDHHLSHDLRPDLISLHLSIPRPHFSHYYRRIVEPSSSSGRRGSVWSSVSTLTPLSKDQRIGEPACKFSFLTSVLLPLPSFPPPCIESSISSESQEGHTPLGFRGG